ncbi:hypothetical protein [Pseudomonas fluorescens]|uniref:hypothetical protein n=1 Tax=Pseudomonas fluorescens TaxID=294 RepID=UPI00165612F7|nr:hypothetical protein [Pseudomonas fluorescens]MBC8783631.1 hypothetical protein [Pseudomonas fluorescens]
MKSEINHYIEWSAELDKHEANLKSGVTARWDDIRSGQDLRMAMGTYKLKCFANRIIQSNSAIWIRLDMLEALRIHLINKHHWTLAQARQVQSEEDFVVLLHEELQQLKLTEDEAAPVRQWTSQLGSRAEYEQHFEIPRA